MKIDKIIKTLAANSSRNSYENNIVFQHQKFNKVKFFADTYSKNAVDEMVNFLNDCYDHNDYDMTNVAGYSAAEWDYDDRGDNISIHAYLFSPKEYHYKYIQTSYFTKVNSIQLSSISIRKRVYKENSESEKRSEIVDSMYGKTFYCNIFKVGEDVRNFLNIEHGNSDDIENTRLNRKIAINTYSDFIAQSNPLTITSNIEGTNDQKIIDALYSTDYKSAKTMDFIFDKPVTLDYNSLYAISLSRSPNVKYMYFGINENDRNAFGTIVDGERFNEDDDMFYSTLFSDEFAGLKRIYLNSSNVDSFSDTDNSMIFSSGVPFIKLGCTNTRMTHLSKVLIGTNPSIESLVNNMEYPISATFKREIKENKDLPFWNRVVEALENCSPSDFNNDLDYIGENDLLKSLKVNSLDSHCNYKFDANSNTFTSNILWKVLGYNASIPEYVKYKSNNGNKIYVKSIKNDLLANIVEGDEVYAKIYDEIIMDHSYIETGIIDSISGSFSYGNNVSYSVPMTIVVGGMTYTFCGYNMTIETNNLITDIAVKQNCILGIPWWNDFNQSNNDEKKNVWSDSILRNWLNTINATTIASSTRIFNSSKIVANIFTNELKSFICRLSNEYGFIENVQKIINKTELHSNFINDYIHDENNYQHTVDRFWVLSQEQITDNDQSTSIFSLTYKNDNNSRIKYALNSNTVTTVNTTRYWLRSIYQYKQYGINCIYEDGSIKSSPVSLVCHGVSPVCVIG